MADDRRHVPPADLHDHDTLPPYVDSPEVDAAPYNAAMSQAMDTEIGRLFEHLRETGEWDETIVFFIGDNGSAGRVSDNPPYGRGRAKGSLYEGGVAVPFIVAGPGMSGPRDIDALVSVADVFPTVLELAGIDVAQPQATHAPEVTLNARSLASCLRDATKTCEGHELMFTQFSSAEQTPSNGVAVRDETHKRICWEDGNTALFDLRADPGERDDLFDTETATAEALRSALRALTGDDAVCP